ncbi:MAG: SEC-C metal-binding domain-containing protein [Planctomycetota bacterium]|nr:SEC-C metal-binding domain-containing protein [Planctomycetota bacterium]
MVKGRNTTYVGVRLPDELAGRLKSEARKRKLSFSDYLRSILATYWKRPGTVYEVQFLPEPVQPSGLPSSASLAGDKVEPPPDLELEPEYRKSPDTKQVKKFTDVARNAPCPCGSGKKYKRCHGATVL